MKYEKEFPILSTKVSGVTETFNLADPDDRKKYFQAKVGKEIAALRNYFDEGNTFIAYLMGKKNSGKGTYTKLIAEIFGSDHIGHISVGDIVRTSHEAIKNNKKKQELLDYLSINYRGYIPLQEAVDALIDRNASTLLPTELILTLIKYQIDSMPKKTLFIDGFPRDLDQISYSLYFRDLINYRNDTDLFVAIDIPDAVIDERIKYRVVCPVCQTPRNLKLFTTKYVGYDKDDNTFYLQCDDPNCEAPKTRMKGKEGDNLGIDTIRERLERDGMLIDKMFTLHGIPKILLRNAIPVDVADKYTDPYEITSAYSYELDDETKKVKTIKKQWSVVDDDGVKVHSLVASAVVISLIKQLYTTLNLETKQNS